VSSTPMPVQSVRPSLRRGTQKRPPMGNRIETARNVLVRVPGKTMTITSDGHGGDREVRNLLFREPRGDGLDVCIVWGCIAARWGVDRRVHQLCLLGAALAAQNLGRLVVELACWLTG